MPKPITLERSCPVCDGNEFWDNRLTKKTPKHPDYKCSNKECKNEDGYPGALWEEEKKPVKKTPPGLKHEAEAVGKYSDLSTLKAQLTRIENAVNTLIKATGKTITDPNGEEAIVDEAPDWSK